jgi:hypothetical protein
MVFILSPTEEAPCANARGVTPVVIRLVNFSNKFAEGSAVNHVFCPGASRERKRGMDNPKGGSAARWMIRYARILRSLLGRLLSVGK